MFYIIFLDKTELHRQVTHTLNINAWFDRPTIHALSRPVFSKCLIYMSALVQEYLKGWHPAGS